jgi:hypothetical protein
VTAGERGDLILFGLLLLFAAILALVAYRLTGPLGMEEGFSQVGGLPVIPEEAGGGWVGFSVEGNQTAYGVVLGALVLLCLFLLLWRGRQGRG